MHRAFGQGKYGLVHGRHQLAGAHFPQLAALLARGAGGEFPGQFGEVLALVQAGLEAQQASPDFPEKPSVRFLQLPGF